MKRHNWAKVRSLNTICDDCGAPCGVNYPLPGYDSECSPLMEYYAPFQITQDRHFPYRHTFDPQNNQCEKCHITWDDFHTLGHQECPQ